MEHLITPEYRPQGSELVVRYHLTPSSDSSFPETLQKLFSELLLGFEQHSPSAQPLHVFDVDQDQLSCQVAFSAELFEPGNAAQHLAIISAALVESPHIDSLHLLSVSWPDHLQAGFPGPLLGASGLRKLLQVRHRPLTAVELLPKIGLRPKQCLEKSYHIWMGGCDIVFEGETICSADSSAFAERLSFISKERDNCSKRTGKSKLYIPNVTASTLSEMQQRIKKAEQAQCFVVAFNGYQCGWETLSSLRSFCTERHIGLLNLHKGSRLSTGQSQFRFAAGVFGSLGRHLGADIQSHTPEGDSAALMTDRFSKQHHHQKACLPLHQIRHSLEEVETLVKESGEDQVIDGSVAVYRHSDGLKAGAEAFQYAVEAAAQGVQQETAISKNAAFKKALTEGV